MAFTDLKRDELVQAAQFYKVDVSANDTKAAIATALLDKGISPDQWEQDREAYENGEDVDGNKRASAAAITSDNFEGSDEEEEPEADAEEDEEEPAEEEPEAQADDSDLVLVRFVGRNASFTTGRHTFSRNQPFALMSEEQFESLDRAKFRKANKAEAEEFFGQ